MGVQKNMGLNRTAGVGTGSYVAHALLYTQLCSLFGRNVSLMKCLLNGFIEWALSSSIPKKNVTPFMRTKMDTNWKVDRCILMNLPVAEVVAVEAVVIALGVAEDVTALDVEVEVDVVVAEEEVSC